MNDRKRSSLLSMIGLAKKAGHAVCGTEQICEAIRRGNKKICLAIVSENASDNTKKKLNDKCAYYGVKLIFVPATPDELGHIVGKSGTVAAVGIDDAGFAAAIENKLNL